MLQIHSTQAPISLSFIIPVIEVDKEGTIRNVTFSTWKIHKLKCNIEGHPRPFYRWTATHTNTTEMHCNILLLENNSHKGGKSVKIDLFGSLKKDFDTGKLLSCRIDRANI